MIKKIKKNILVVGTGSIGRRHISNLLSSGCSVGVYSYRHKVIDGLDEVFYEQELSPEIFKKYDAVVIANNTDKHLDIAKICIKENKPFYIEKPISHNFNDVDDINSKIIDSNLYTKVGYMMRAHPNLVFLKNYLKKNKKTIYYVSANVGQWLKDWRPGTDYRDCYSAHKDQGGGVIFDLIHELDIAHWLFGEMDKIFCHKDKVSNLEINTEDFAHIILKSFEGFTIDIKFDYLRATYRRDIEIVMDGSTIFWDYVSGTVTLYEKLTPKGVIIHYVGDEFDRNKMFEDVMDDFILELDGNAQNPNSSSFHQGTYSMMLAVKSHESAETNKWIKL